MNVLKEEQGKVGKSLAVEPKGIGYNMPPQELNIIVSEQGRTIFLIHNCDVIVIDPAENI